MLDAIFLVVGIGLFIWAIGGLGGKRRQEEAQEKYEEKIKDSRQYFKSQGIPTDEDGLPTDEYLDSELSQY